MQLFLGCVYVFVGVFLQVSSQEVVDSTISPFLSSETAKTYSTKDVIAESSTTMSSTVSTSKGSPTTPETGTVMTTQNSSAVATGQTNATVVSSSESSTTVPSSITAQKHNATTTESGHSTSTQFSTSNFTGKEASTTNTAAHKLTSETATASSDFRSTLPSVRPSEHDETTGYLSTNTMQISTSAPTAPKASKFDPASFLGGIVLALGVCVIAVFGYRCYRNRRSTSPPYRIVDE